jgi:hypothetical protein
VNRLADPFPTAFAAGLVHQDAAHGLGRGGKEVAAAVPLRLSHLRVARRRGRNQPQIGFIHQGGRLQCLPRLLVGELLGRQLAQLVVDQRQELVGGVRVALFDGGQDAGDIGHRRHRKVEGLSRTTAL